MKFVAQIAVAGTYTPEWSPVEIDIGRAHSDSPNRYALTLPSGSGAMISSKAVDAFLSGKAITVRIDRTYLVKEASSAPTVS